ncbi:hypothetical protein OSB04_022491 [Centaurea solstitialis]|uniref:Prokaryotic-type class I peptide chain release factors domain-containing protein n=1 Tax=Centaurea solstitialis TaxID=347529 RepID=A0AA38T424_9ASTR|nr:hypothetical protein OSB04_022491 [Centaurea solstitialis]
MAAIRTTATVFLKQICRPSPSPPSIRTSCKLLFTVSPPLRLISRPISYASIRCAAASNSDAGKKKTSARMSQVQQQLHEAMERSAGGDEPIPKITLDHVTVSFARSGGPGGQNVNKGLIPIKLLIQEHCIWLHCMPSSPVPILIISFAVNTKVDMRFNVTSAYWLSDRVREKILQMVSSLLLHSFKFNHILDNFCCPIVSKSSYHPYIFFNQEKNRINKDGELVISSTRTRTQKGNIEDALEKLQAIIDAASYVPPPPSEEQVKKINKIAAAAEHKRLQNKKVLSQKKAFRRSRDSYD